MAETVYTLNITVRNKIATTTDPTTVVNGNNDYTVVFDFDSEWDSLSSKTAMFVYGREEQKYKTVTFTGNSCVMPALYNTGYVLIGVFAGNIKTTTAAYVKCLPCIRDNDSTLDAGSGGTIDTGTNDHSQLINRDIADQHPISAITGLEEALTPLVGTTQTVTPSQVLAAIKAGRDVALQYTDSYYGTFVFSAFDASEQVGIVVSDSFLPHLDGARFTLLGNADNESCFFDVTIPATKDDVGTAVNEALAAAKASGEFDGADGLTPTIGENGNWYLGNTDTGKPSRGDKGDTGAKGEKGDTGATGAAGKSAYSYAQDGGYTGTEAEFAAKLAQEKFANPNALTFTGAVEGSYDGSEPLTLEIPSGGGAAVETWDLLINAEIAEDCTEVIFNSGDAGEVLSNYKELLLLIDLFGNTGGFTSGLKIGFLNAVTVWHSPYALQMTGYSAETVKYYINMFRFKKTEYGILPVNRYTQYNSGSMSDGLSHASGITSSSSAPAPDFGLPISAAQHVTTDMIDFASQKEFERLVIGGYQAVIGAGTIIKVWGMK